MELNEAQKRVVEEASQLDAKIERLEAFLAAEYVTNVVSAHEITLMGSQLEAMKTYSVFLRARIEYWATH